MRNKGVRQCPELKDIGREQGRLERAKLRKLTCRSGGSWLHDKSSRSTREYTITERRRGRTMADLCLPEQPLEPTALEAVAVQDVREPILRVHARVVCELRAFNQDCARPYGSAQQERASGRGR